MRIWSVHPKHLDSKGLVALWRESLLAKNVLEGKTKGYKNHPQLNRFKQTLRPLDYINAYLCAVWLESKERNYNFDSKKIIDIGEIEKIPVTKGQLQFEKTHLLKKLKQRDAKMYAKVKQEQTVVAHPLFKVVPGNVESWEKV